MNKRSLGMLTAIMGMAAYASQESRNMFYSEPEPKKLQPYKHRERPLKGNQKKYTFEDGFSCIATNQRNADRKHKNWINNK